MSDYYYFGPWERAGHYFFSPRGRSATFSERERIPWNDCDIDGKLQPLNTRQQGAALLHHRDGWTALSFWDSSVDTRPGCNSTYLARGTWSFDEMATIAKQHFAWRWSRMRFEVVPHSAEPPCQTDTEPKETP
jgi:hypothetical protein